MKRHLVRRYFKLWNLGFLLVSGFEIIAFIILSFFIPVVLNSQSYTVMSLLFSSGLTSPHMPLLWIILFTSISILLVFPILLLVISNNDEIKDITYARILLFVGFSLLTANFIKVEGIYILSKSIVDPLGTPFTFEFMLYNPGSTPFFGAALWIYFTASVCVYLISGLVFSAIGLKWMLLLEKKEIK